MPTVYVNQQPVELPEGARLNCVQAAQLGGVEIPHYCFHPELSIVASCRMCLIEVGEKKPDGSIVMQPKVVPGCQTPVKDGTVIVTNTPKVEAAQKGTLEYLLLNHPLDCPVCDQAGECGLQDYSYKYGRGVSRLKEPKNIKPDKDHIGEQITLFTDRCIMCTRCVRFTREISGTAELQVISRGTHEEIDIFPGTPCNNKLAGNVVDLCPVGALCSKDFLYQQRVWWLKVKNSVCPGCSTGCSITVEQNNDVLYRLKPRTNPQAQGYFMCDEGRFGWKYLHSDRRLLTPIVRDAGRITSTLWEAAAPQLLTSLQRVSREQPDGLLAVISPWATVEEAYLLAELLKRLSPTAQLVLGPVRVDGADDQYPKDLHGNAQQTVKFTIRAEKCPNRRGVAAVLQHFEGQVRTLDDVSSKLAAGEFSAVYLLGGDPEGWGDALPAAVASKLPLLIVQDILANELTELAHFVLAGSAWAERDGTFVNHSGLAQAIQRGLRSPGESRADGRILWELGGRRGLFNGPALRREIAAAIPALQGLAVGDLGRLGVQAGDAVPTSNGTTQTGATVPGQTALTEKTKS